MKIKIVNSKELSSANLTAEHYVKNNPMRDLVENQLNILKDDLPTDGPSVEEFFAGELNPKGHEAETARAYLLGVADAANLTILELLDHYGIEI